MRRVETWSDIHCPWALVALHRLRRAGADQLDRSRRARTPAFEVHHWRVTTMTHPYDPLTAQEIERAVHAVLASQPGLQAPRFPLVRLAPPGKEAVRRGETSPAGRSAFLVTYDRETGSTFEARVDLTANTVTSWK